jgi:mono/diheme cytochrome c family protein
MRAFRILLIILVVIVVGVAIAGWSMMSRGFSAQMSPSGIESFIAPRMRNLAIPRKARDAKNPIADNPEVFSEATAHFADHCAICHSADGSGETHMGKGLFPKPPDLRENKTQDLTDGEIYYIIENGVRYTGMPAFGQSDDSGRDEDTWKLVRLIRHFPTLTPEQVQQIDQMTPKSPMELQREQDIQNFLQGGDVPMSHEHHQH